MDDHTRRISALLTRCLDAAAGATSALAHQRILSWLAAIASWNRKIDLTKARNDAELVDLMVADAAVLSRHLPESASVVDVGSGPGAPGLPLALLRTDLHVTLVEPKQKRTALLRTMLGRFAADSGPPLTVEVAQARVEQLGERTFDVAQSRATLEPEAWLAAGAQLAPAGEVWVLLATQRPPELDGWEVAHDQSYQWPLTSAPRRALCYRPRGASH